ncbi:hypothetical protein ILUMI_06682 [Ignelater luminosus]|uniref:Uncharacterized protein n=1 Tax=Ignelater luminosus TaxID=2038154 RepID=A0A8K0DA61_IGNLU|nr:hypothetical protein ILUMI_06682 [Ignelater luminosus]
MGIIENLKTKYRAKLGNFILEKIEETLLDLDSTAKEVSSQVKILQAKSFVADIWRDINNKTLKNCFACCNFKVNTLTENLDDSLEKLDQEINDYIVFQEAEKEEYLDEDIVDEMKERLREVKNLDCDSKEQPKSTTVALPEA